MRNILLALAIVSLNHYFLQNIAEIFMLFMFALTFAYSATLMARTVAIVIAKTGLSVGLSRKIALLLIVFTGAGFVYGSIYVLYPIIKSQAIDIFNKIGDDSFRNGLIDNMAGCLGLSKNATDAGMFTYAHLHSIITRIFTELMAILNRINDIDDLSGVASKTGSVMHIGLHVLMTLIMSIHILKDWGKWNGKALYILDSLDVRKEYRDRAILFMENFDIGFKGWLLGQLLISLILSSYYLICFWSFKLKGALLVALVSGFSAFAPYLGDVITMAAVGIAVSLTSGITVLKVLIIVLAIILGHCIGSYILIPMLMKQHTGVSPLQVIIGMLLFKSLFGIPGIVMNIPMLVTINAAVRAIFFKLPDEPNAIKE